MRKKTKVWLDGFINGIITGGVTSVLSALGIVAAESAGMEIKGLAFDQLCGIFFSSCVVNACIYIKQNQLPPIFNNEDTIAELRKEDLPKDEKK